MTPEQAKYQAMGYAWGREDVSKVPTADGAGGQSFSGYAFGVAFAQGWEDYNAEKRGYMTCVGRAYDRWQESNGRTIFQDGDSTAELQARYAYEKIRHPEDGADAAFIARHTIR